MYGEVFLIALGNGSREMLPPAPFSLTATCARPQVEPIVDCVDARQVVTDAVPLLSIDLATCTVADLSFESTFELTAGYDDYVSCAHFLGLRAHLSLA